MKYYTLDDWIAEQDADVPGVHERVEAYREYAESIKHLLPEDFRVLMDTICIHDAAVREIDCEIPEGRVSLRLDAGDLTMREPRYVRLVYEGAHRALTLADKKKFLRSSGGGYGDLGFDEIEVLGGGIFEHRMIFSSGIEIAVRFRRFRLEILGGPL